MKHYLQYANRDLKVKTIPLTYLYGEFTVPNILEDFYPLAVFYNSVRVGSLELYNENPDVYCTLNDVNSLVQLDSLNQLAFFPATYQFKFYKNGNNLVSFYGNVEPIHSSVQTGQDNKNIVYFSARKASNTSTTLRTYLGTDEYNSPDASEWQISAFPFVNAIDGSLKRYFNFENFQILMYIPPVVNTNTYNFFLYVDRAYNYFEVSSTFLVTYLGVKENTHVYKINVSDNTFFYLYVAYKGLPKDLML
ncbi:hypothetical protein [Flavobacterium gawalongense]|uniref:Uncharacterized protein n=1 Tax=Flavobacterium gawalongense TaxID=2594432 RepID=A0ABY3CGC3_9FLAO|nr:hypothetical protein [Flavobacterium gawalongense]TRW98503.1 hypothetical protein FNW33_15955 [Flavobacterium gawalongense]TRX02880.1 hypothetical protein FNW12_15860 [Flavobacterium gawalongense]